MARRPSAYQSGKGDDSLEALSDMLSADLRGAIKALVSRNDAVCATGTSRYADCQKICV